MKLQQINKAIEGLCLDVEEIIQAVTWRDMTESEIINELLVCILGSGVRYEVAVSYAHHITEKEVLPKLRLENQEVVVTKLSQLLSNGVSHPLGDKQYKSYRYPNAKAQYIAESYFNLNEAFGSFKNLLMKNLCAKDLRREVIDLCPGIGPKQASHFLKNIGYTDSLAVLDRHIINYLSLVSGSKISSNQLTRLDKYEELEKVFIDVVRVFKHSVSIVDQSMWFIMRALKSEVKS